MDRQEHLKFCRICLNRQFDINKGIICKLTNNIADFENYCDHFLKDESIWIKETIEEKSKKSQRKEKKIRNEFKSKKRIKEKLTTEDLYLLLATSVPTILMLRLMNYIISDRARPNIIYATALLFLVSFTVTILLRKKEIKQYRILGDLKFKLMFAVLLTILNGIYVAVVFANFHHFLAVLFYIFLVSGLVNLLSFVVVIPTSYFLKKITGEHD